MRGDGEAAEFVAEGKRVQKHVVLAYSHPLRVAHAGPDAGPMGAEDAFGLRRRSRREEDRGGCGVRDGLLSERFSRLRIRAKAEKLLDVLHGVRTVRAVDIDAGQPRQLMAHLSQNGNEIGLQKSRRHEEKPCSGEIEHETELVRPVAGIQGNEYGAGFHHGKLKQHIPDGVRVPQTAPITRLQPLRPQRNGKVIGRIIELPERKRLLAVNEPDLIRPHPGLRVHYLGEAHPFVLGGTGCRPDHLYHTFF